MNIVEVPKVLFQEFSKKLGKGEEIEVSIDGHSYLLKELNSEVAGLRRAIGFREESSLNGPKSTFVLWEIVPQGQNNFLKPTPVRMVFKIAAGPEDAGRWACGNGRRMTETCRADFSHYGFSLRNPNLRLILSILQRASELAPTAKCEEFWENERNPEQIFVRPPR